MRGKINWTWKKVTGTILGILGIGTLVSCYGMVEDDDLSVLFLRIKRTERTEIC